MNVPKTGSLAAIIEWYRRPYQPPPLGKMRTVLALTLLFNFLDGALTYVCVSLGLSYEANLIPALMIGRGWWLFFLVKVGIGSAVIYYLYRRLAMKHVLGWYTLMGFCIALGLLSAVYVISLAACIVIDIIY